MSPMTPRQRSFMAALLQTSKRQNSVVAISEVCQGLKMAADECGEIIRWAAKAGLLNDLGGDQTILTGAGRSLAEELVAADG